VRDMYTQDELWGWQWRKTVFPTANDEYSTTGWDKTGELWVAVVAGSSDSTPPVVEVTDDGLATSNPVLHATWLATDAESGVVSYQTAVTSLSNPTPTWSAETHTTTGTAPMEFTGEPCDQYYFHVRVKNGRDMWGEGVSDGITIDTTPPEIAITSPAGTVWHKASGATTILVSGTADDGETGSGVDTVNVRIGAGSWEQASYNPSTKAWSYTWQNCESARFTARATDFAGNQGETFVDVAIPDPDVSVIYVQRPPAGDDENDGLSWQSAKATVQAGISEAAPGWDVWVAAGTYIQSLTHESGIGLYGGFAGAETVREQRDWRTHVTVLQGDGSEQTPGTGTVVVLPDGSDPAAVVDGFTIQYGDVGLWLQGADAPSSPRGISHNTIRRNREGLWCEASPTITNNLIVENVDSGIQCPWYSSPRIANNTIARNVGSYWGGIGVMGGSPIVSNNLIACNQPYGIVCLAGSAPVLNNNCVYGNGNSSCDNSTSCANYGGLYGRKPPDPPVPPPGVDGNISLNPMFVDPAGGNYHIRQHSPCVGAGRNDLADGDLDIDGQPRLSGPGAIVDIGADEVSGEVLTLTAAALTVPISVPAAVTARFANWASAAAIRNREVCFSVSSGTLESPASPGCALTNSSGETEATVSRTSPGTATVTVLGYTSSGEQVTDSVDLWFYDPNAKPVEISFCVDCTGSMAWGGDHRAHESIEAFLEDLADNHGVALRVGGIKFNDTMATGEWCWYDPDTMNFDRLRSLKSSTTVADFVSNWVYDGYAAGGNDCPELQLDAFHYAVQDMAAHSIPDNPNRYIVLITDQDYHEDYDELHLTKQGMVNELTNSGCHVYISYWEQIAQCPGLPDVDLQQRYDGLTVNGAFDPSTTQGPIYYPLTNLHDAILANWP